MAAGCPNPNIRRRRDERNGVRRGHRGVCHAEKTESSFCIGIRRYVIEVSTAIREVAPAPGRDHTDQHPTGHSESRLEAEVGVVTPLTVSLEESACLCPPVE